jgi:hypothetical protein
MEINEQGFFVVQSGETITITVTASNTKFMASFPPAPSCTQWSSVMGPAEDSGSVITTESRQFVTPASGSQCFVSIIFDFIPDQAGAFPPDAKYDIKIEGSASGSFDDFPVLPPPLVSRAYRFQVGLG